MSDESHLEEQMTKNLIILTVCLCLTCATGANGQDIDVDDLTYMTEEYRPYNYTEDGRLKGISVELLQLMWAKMGFGEQPIRVYPWARGYSLLQERENHVLFATTRTEERENQFKWVGPLYNAKIVLISLAESSVALNSLEDAKSYQIGTIQEDVSEQLLVAAGFNKGTLQSVSRIEQNIKKLLKGRIELIAYTERSFKNALQVKKINPDKFKTVFVVKEIKSYFAFNKSVPDVLIQRFQQALDSLRVEHQIILDENL